jgi:hypothetical protein
MWYLSLGTPLDLVAALEILEERFAALAFHGIIYALCRVIMTNSGEA